MFKDLNNDDMLEYLMTSDFDEKINEKDLKFLLKKFRSFYRYMYGAKDTKVTDGEFKIKTLTEQVDILNKKIISLEYENSELKNDINIIKNKKLTLIERIKGKINFK